jgi:PAS domain S-box-containing protein
MKNLPNLLVVDDAEVNLLLFETVINKNQVNLINALSGPEALEKTHGFELALAVIDVQMPGMNGYELAVKINEERFGDKVPIIFVTASHNSEMELLKGYNSGAVDYIFKPVDSHILLCKINVFLGLFNQRQTILRDAELLKESADELKKANAALKNSEEKYRSYINNAPDGVFVADETGKYVEVNEAACKITGYTEDELLRMSIQDILTEESREDGVAQFREVVNIGTSKSELSFRHKDGTKRWWSVESVMLSETRFLGFTKDITRRKEMEASLRAYQIELEMQNAELMQAKEKAEIATTKYTELYDFAPSGYLTLSEDCVIQALNYSAANMLGKDRSCLIKDQFDSFISIDTQPIFNDFFREVFKSKSKQICEVSLQINDRQIKHVHIEGAYAGKIENCLLNVVDITERKAIEQAIRVSEEKYKTMLNASPDGILLIDQHGIITEASEIGIELIGTDNRAELVGNNILFYVPEDEKNNIKEIFERTMNEGLVQNIGIKIRKKNNFLFAAEISVTLIQDPHGVPLSYMVTIRDISQRKKLETKQIHADRMANLGEMATGIAHEINQPLNIISMVMDKILFETIKTGTVDIELLKNKANKIFENIIRIRNIIDHIRAFSRSHDDYILTSFDINLSIENAASMIMEQFKHLGITLNLQLEKQIPQILGNTYKFEQVIVNLLINAKDAVIEMKNKNEEYNEMIVGIRSFQEDRSIIVEISDNGIGISNEDIHNIMLPFYTTKDEGKGTGLGLSICYQIIKEMKGIIDITSDKFKGTTIKLFFTI